MIRMKSLVIIIGILVLLMASQSLAQEGSSGQPKAVGEPVYQKRNMALGLSVDLLTTAMGAIDGSFEMSVQPWIGIDHLRIRMVGARFRMLQFPIGTGVLRGRRPQL